MDDHELLIKIIGALILGIVSLHWYDFRGMKKDFRQLNTTVLGEGGINIRLTRIETEHSIQHKRQGDLGCTPHHRSTDDEEG